jgi:hypothetical protein
MTDETITTETEAPAPLTPVARLDADGLFDGLDHLPESEITEDHIVLPDGCDLPPGQYRWDRERQSFIHAGAPEMRAAESLPPLNALAWGLLTMWNANLTLPAKSARWLDGYIQTIDFVGSSESADEAQIVAAYAKERGIAK